MRKSLTIIVILLVSIFCKGQSWFCLGSGIPQDSNTEDFYVQSLSEYDNNLYVGGIFDTAGGKPANNITKWNGTSWSSLGSGANGNVYALTVYNGTLIAGGSFNTIGGIAANSIAEWNDTVWSPLGRGINGAFVEIYALIVYNGNLFAGGIFDSAGSISANNIAEWNGTSWTALGNGLTGLGPVVQALTVYNSKLVVGGEFDSAGGKSANNIAIWDGVSWNTLGNRTNCFIYALDSFHNNLYAAGCFSTPGSEIARWNDTIWSSVGSGLSGWEADALTTYNGNLYVGGAFSDAGGVTSNDIAEWNDTTWISLGNKIPYGFLNQIEALYVYNGSLIVGGIFDTIGSVPANCIAGWGMPSSINEIKDNNEKIHLYPNPNNGLFTIEQPGISRKSSIEVYNMLGENIYAAPLNSPKGGTYSIDLNNNPSGIYFYRILTETGELVSSGKMVIQK